MRTIRQLSGEELDAFVRRLMDRVKEKIFAGRDHTRTQKITLRATTYMVQFNFKHRRYGAGGVKGSDR